MSHRRLFLVLALAVLFAVLAAAAVLGWPSTAQSRSAAVVHVAAVEPGPSADSVRRAESEAVSAAVLAAWRYVAGLAVSAPVASPPPAPARRPAARPAPTPAASDDVAAAIAAHFGPIADQATRVANCESSLNPSAVSRGGGNWGLFQINSTWRDEFPAVTGVSWDAGVLDANTNAQFARWLYDRDGWGPWACRWAA